METIILIIAGVSALIMFVAILAILKGDDEGEEEAQTSETDQLAESTRLHLDAVHSQWKLNEISDQECAELCRTINDAANKEAERLIEEMEKRNDSMQL